MNQSRTETLLQEMLSLIQDYYGLIESEKLDIHRYYDYLKAVAHKHGRTGIITHDDVERCLQIKARALIAEFEALLKDKTP